LEFLRNTAPEKQHDNTGVYGSKKEHARQQAGSEFFTNKVLLLKSFIEK
jgi:hypothetical protein